MPGAPLPRHRPTPGWGPPRGAAAPPQLCRRTSTVDLSPSDHQESRRSGSTRTRPPSPRLLTAPPPRVVLLADAEPSVQHRPCPIGVTALLSSNSRGDRLRKRSYAHLCFWPRPTPIGIDWLHSKSGLGESREDVWSKPEGHQGLVRTSGMPGELQQIPGELGIKSGASLCL